MESGKLQNQFLNVLVIVTIGLMPLAGCLEKSASAEVSAPLTEHEVAVQEEQSHEEEVVGASNPTSCEDGDTCTVDLRSVTGSHRMELKGGTKITLRIIAMENEAILRPEGNPCTIVEQGHRVIVPEGEKTKVDLRDSPDGDWYERSFELIVHEDTEFFVQHFFKKR